MSDIIFIWGILSFPCVVLYMLYVLFSRLIELIQQKRADDMRKAYQSRKAAVERQARQRL
ncbi:hypothetical protein SODG_002025 [Sodalis praecaptivus]|uniref:hypothetical protein n=1 Tax=Sodalis praecaptivus TaxID=1239307 RepID=UPI0027FFEFFC|nr:hypothetical protein [Sodalis praecaptivus]CAJ0999660.1 hypothetical protein NVIRENTERO_03930 [Sodalis praecaptivus]